MLLSCFIILVVFAQTKTANLNTGLDAIENKAVNILKEELIKNDSPSRVNVKLIDKRLAFNKFEDYERIINQPSEKQLNEFKETLKSFNNFKPLSYVPYTRENANKRNKIINDDFFASILSQEQTIQIDSFIFKINAEMNMVYVLPLKFQTEYSDLVLEKIKNKHIIVFSTEENVLELLKNKTRQSATENNLSASRPFFCREGGIGGKHAELYLGSAQTAYADFVRLGIFFTLKATISPMGSSGSNYTFRFDGDGWVHYHVRCGSTADYGNFSTQGSWMGTERKYQSYQGSTNLNNLFFAFRVLNSSTGLPIIAGNPMVVIRQNW